MTKALSERNEKIEAINKIQTAFEKHYFEFVAPTTLWRALCESLAIITELQAENQTLQAKIEKTINLSMLKLNQELQAKVTELIGIVELQQNQVKIEQQETSDLRAEVKELKEELKIPQPGSMWKQKFSDKTHRVEGIYRGGAEGFDPSLNLVDLTDYDSYIFLKDFWQHFEPFIETNLEE